MGEFFSRNRIPTAKQLCTRKPVVVFGKFTYDRDIVFRFFEERGKQLPEFIPERTIFPEEKQFDVLRQAKLRPQVVQVVRYATHDHVAFEDLLSRKMYVVGLQKLFTFLQAKRHQMDLTRQTVVKSTRVLHDVVDDPGSG